MRILFDVSSLFRDGRVESGVPSYTLSLIEIFKSLPHEVAFFYSGRKSFGLENYVSEYIHLPIPSKILQFLTLLGVKTDWLIKKFGVIKNSGNNGGLLLRQLADRNDNLFYFDVYFTPNISTFYRYFSSKIKVVGVVHDLSQILFPEMKAFGERWKYFGQYKTHLVERLVFWNRNRKPIFERFDHLIAISEHTKNDLMEFLKIPEEKITVIYPHGTWNVERGTKDTPPLSPPFEGGVRGGEIFRKFNIQKPYLLSLGHIEPRKNVENLIRAFSIIKRSRPDLQLVAVGRMGYQSEKLLKLCDENKFSIFNFQFSKATHYPLPTTHFPDVVFTGPVSEEEKYSLMQNAEVFVYPSLYEGFAYPCLEAMSVGTPVVTSPVSALPEVLGDSALYADPWRPESIAAIVQELLRDENLRTDLIEKGRACVKKFQNLEIQPKQWDTLFKSIKYHGFLQHSKVFSGDPVAYQQKIRSEWDRK